MKNVTKNTIVAFAIIMGLALSTETQAQNRPERKGPPNVDQLLKEMDANGDAHLSVEEVKGPLANDFDKIDTDKDGLLSKEELEKAPKPKPKGGQRPPR